MHPERSPFRHKLIVSLLLLFVAGFCGQSSFAVTQIDYRLLDCRRTAELEKEIEQAASEGYRASLLVKSVLVGNEIIAVMTREAGQNSGRRFQYRLVATSKTSTAEKEMNQAAAEGFYYKASTVQSTTFGGAQTVFLMEKELASPPSSLELKLLAATRTNTIREELQAATNQGFRVEDIVYGATAWGGAETIVILSRPRGVTTARYQYQILDSTPTTVEPGFVFKGVGSGFKSDFYVMEKDLSHPADKVEYKVYSAMSLSKIDENLRAALQEGFRCVGVYNLSTSGGLGFRNSIFMMAKGGTAAGNWEQQFIHASSTSRFQQELSNWAAQGYELVGFSAWHNIEAVLIKAKQ